MKRELKDRTDDTVLRAILVEESFPMKSELKIVGPGGRAESDQVEGLVPMKRELKEAGLESELLVGRNVHRRCRGSSLIGIAQITITGEQEVGFSPLVRASEIPRLIEVDRSEP